MTSLRASSACWVAAVATLSERARFCCCFIASPDQFTALKQSALVVAFGCYSLASDQQRLGGARIVGGQRLICQDGGSVTSCVDASNSFIQYTVLTDHHKRLCVRLADCTAVVSISDLKTDLARDPQHQTAKSSLMTASLNLNLDGSA